MTHVITNEGVLQQAARSAHLLAGLISTSVEVLSINSTCVNAIELIWQTFNIGTLSVLQKRIMVMKHFSNCGTVLCCTLCQRKK